MIRIKNIEDVRIKNTQSLKKNNYLDIRILNNHRISKQKHLIKRSERSESNEVIY